jgi:hypothetical protein
MNSECTVCIGLLSSEPGGGVTTWRADHTRFECTWFIAKSYYRAIRVPVPGLLCHPTPRKAAPSRNVSASLWKNPLTADEILSHFGQHRAIAQENYCGINRIRQSSAFWRQPRNSKIQDPKSSTRSENT